MTDKRVEKEEQALAGAAEAFTRYGYARTTMGDIAARAGMSRPALYLVFPDKDAIFARVIRRMDDDKLKAIRTALSQLQTLEARLLSACLEWGLHGVELAAVHPDADDLFDLRFPAVREVYARFEAFVVELIDETARAAGIAAAPEDLARTLVYGMRGLRAAASGPAEMRRLVTVQVQTFVRALTLI